VKVMLERVADGKLRLAIADDGVGYLAESTKPGIGSRLLGVFARQVHGTAAVDTKPGQGTVVELVFDDPEQVAPAEPRIAVRPDQGPA